MWNFCRIDSEIDSYFEERSSDAEEKAVGPFHVDLEINLEESPESLPPSSLSPVVPPQSISVGELSPVWELPNNETNIVKSYTKVGVLALKTWVQETRSRRNKEGYLEEEPVLAPNFVAFLREHHGPQWEFRFLQAAAEQLSE